MVRRMKKLKCDDTDTDTDEEVKIEIQPVIADNVEKPANDDNDKQPEVIEPGFVKDLCNKMLGQCCSAHNLCREINRMILDNIHNGLVYPPYIVNSYIRFLSKVSNAYYYDYYNTKKCLSKPENYMEALSALISFGCPSRQSIYSLIDFNSADVIKNIKDNGYKIDSSCLTHAIHKNTPVICDILSSYENITVSAKHLELATEKNMEATVMNILTRRVAPTEKTIIFAIKNKNLNLVKTILNLGVQLDNSLLETACASREYEIIKLFLDLKLLPSTKCFENIIHAGRGEHEREEDYYYYSKRKEKATPALTQLIDLLVAYGYKIQYNDAVLATKYRIKINNLEIMDLKLDSKFLEVCAEHNFFYDLPNIKTTVKCLEKACLKQGNLSYIKDLTKKIKIKPNSKCLENACRHRSNIQAIKYLIDQGAQPSFKCIEQVALAIGNRTLSLIIHEYKKTLKNDNDAADSDADSHVDALDADVLDADADIDTDTDAVTDAVTDAFDDDGMDAVIDDADTVTENVIDNGDDTVANVVTDADVQDGKIDTIITANNTEIVEIQDEDEGNLEEITVKKGKGKNGPKNKVLVRGKKKKINNNKDKNVTKVPKSETNDKDKVMINVPKSEIDTSASYDLNDILCKLVHGKVGIPTSYLDVKQKILEYIKNNDLFDKGNKLLIKINKELNDVCGYGENAYISFVDFDNFIMQCISKNIKPVQVK